MPVFYKKLFKGLYIYDKWDWNKVYPVIKIDFADGIMNSRKELDEIIYEHLGILHITSKVIYTLLGKTPIKEGVAPESVKYL